MYRKVFFLGGLSLIVLSGLFIGIRSLRPAGAVHLEKTAPELSLPLLFEEESQMAISSLKGKVVLLDFFATWCKPCRVELPILAKLYQKFQHRGLEVIAINAIEQERIGREGVKRFVQRLHLPFPVVLDVGDVAMATYRVQGLPTLFLLDQSGVVRAVYQGAQSEEELEKAIETFLSK